MWREYQIPADALYFEAGAANSTVTLNKTGSPTAVSLETSTDGSTWTDYTIGNTITLSNIGDKVYFRNTSETTTSFSTGTSNYYNFSMTGSINASGDINYLLCKNSTDTLLGKYCFYSLFEDCSSLLTSPTLPATTLTRYCYNRMFHGCTNLETLPKLLSTAVEAYSYNYMFSSCSKIKVSTSQTGEYQTEYRLPFVGSGTAATGALTNMFRQTGGTFTGTPSINTTYYTSNTLV